jgi:hypothetical protein
LITVDSYQLELLNLEILLCGTKIGAKEGAGALISAGLSAALRNSGRASVTRYGSSAMERILLRPVAVVVAMRAWATQPGGGDSLDVRG